MSYMIYRCMNVPVNLVSKAYYKDEIAYQEVIDAKKNTLELRQLTNDGVNVLATGAMTVLGWWVMR